MNLEMLRQCRAAARQSLMEEQCVLMHESERDEFGEASGFRLQVAKKERMPQRCAVRMTSTHCAVDSLLAERMCRISSSRISAAVPGSVPRPLSRSIAR